MRSKISLKLCNISVTYLIWNLLFFIIAIDSIYLRYVIYIMKRVIRDISSPISCQIHYLILYLRVKYQFHSFRNFQQIIWHENTIVKLFNVTSRSPTTMARFLMQIPRRKLYFKSLIILYISVKTYLPCTPLLVSLLI